MNNKTPSGRRTWNWIRMAADLSLAAGSVAWAVFSIHLPILWHIPGVLLFVALLVLRGYALMRDFNKKLGVNIKIGQYLNSASVYRYLAAGMIIGVSGLLLRLFLIIESYTGGMNLLLIFDGAILVIIVITFFRRPGISDTLSRSRRLYGEEEMYLRHASRRARIKQPELRLVKPRVEGAANASSWSVPGAGSFIFATEPLFKVLEYDEVISIFLHEMGHLRFHHSEFSFLIMAFSPLLWLNLVLIPFMLSSILIAVTIAIAAFAAAVLYALYGRGLLSKKFEDAADRFAVSNSSKEIYISSLQKLTSYNEKLNGGNLDNSRTHRMLEERMEKIMKIL